MNKSQSRLLFVDTQGGSYLGQALLLRNYFNKIGYTHLKSSPFERLSLSEIGTGYEDLTIEQDIFACIDDYDIFFLSDLLMEGLRDELKKRGKKVFGGGSILEEDRSVFNQVIQRLGLDTIPTTEIQGLDALIKYLSNKQNIWCKIDPMFRGETETFKWISKTSSQNILDELTMNLGPLKNDLKFYCQPDVDSVAESGTDAWVINGKMVTDLSFGVENKNIGYLATHSTVIPAALKEVLDKFLPALKNYTGMFSTEVRLTDDGQVLFTDPCLRLASPPSLSLIANITNFGDIIEKGCDGIVIEPVYKHKYSCEVIMRSSYVNNPGNFLSVSFPEEYKDNVYCKGSFIRNGQIYIIPFKKVAGYDLEECVHVINSGNDFNKLMQDTIEICNQVEGYDLRYDSDALEKSLSEIQNMEQHFNIKF